MSVRAQTLEIVFGEFCKVKRPKFSMAGFLHFSPSADVPLPADVILGGLQDLQGRAFSKTHQEQKQG